MELETVRNAITRELDWDNALVLNAGSFSSTLDSSGSGSGTYVDINGNSHTLASGESFNVEWTVPSDGRLSLVRTRAADAHLISTTGVPQKLLENPVFTGSVAMQHIYVSTTEVKYFLKSQYGNLKATLISSKVESLANATVSQQSIVVYTTVPCDLIDDVTVGRECVKGDKISTNTTVPVVSEPPQTSYNALLFVPYKKG